MHYPFCLFAVMEQSDKNDCLSSLSSPASMSLEGSWAGTSVHDGVDLSLSLRVALGWFPWSFVVFSQVHANEVIVLCVLSLS